ncbi:MAG: hypothetical protein ACLFTB_07860 [Desulfovibrionales bacterium]
MGFMETLKTLAEDMASSTTVGFIGVTAIVLFLIAIIAAAIFRIREQKKSDHH